MATKTIPKLTKDTQKSFFGTKEYADQNVNFSYGCKNNCVYCYAKGKAKQYKRDYANTWGEPTLNEKVINKGWNLRQGTLMFPSTHDIYPENLEAFMQILHGILEPGNDVLVVTKPNFECIKTICQEFQDDLSQLEFRFTITSGDNAKLQRYEPEATLIEDRLRALMYAERSGYKTSVSIEPFLDGPKELMKLIRVVQKYASTIWIGQMNHRYCPKEYDQPSIWSIPALQRLHKSITSNPKITQSKIRFKKKFRDAIGLKINYESPI